MEWMVLLHVVTAVLGLGPAYAFPFIMGKMATEGEMARALGLVTRLEMFPKLFGTVAVLSGILLFVFGDYGTWLQVWILGTLILYVVIEVMIIGFMAPAVKKLQTILADTGSGKQAEPQTIALYARVRNLHLGVGILSLFIFALMILKPH